MSHGDAKAAQNLADIDVAQRVLNLESDALKVLSQSLDQQFIRAVDTLLNVQGRVVVSGMGKSGLVGRKIAATFSSTGTPAHFIHPGEASHGDMGAITNSDAVLVLSNSGKTQEIGDLVAHTRRYQIPLIGIASGAGSMLLESSDVELLLPRVAEACPMGLAPTTSTTMMLALGDALAVTLMERRGFSADEYRVLHPGGQLGKALIRVSDIMHADDAMPLVKVGTGLQEAIIEMTAKRFGCTGVLDQEGRLVGIITDGDLSRYMDAQLLERQVEEVMTKDPHTIQPGKLAAEALGIMNTRTRPITCLFVVNEKDQSDANAKHGRPVGILHIHDCLRAGIT